jgi:hypothetical protein
MRRGELDDPAREGHPASLLTLASLERASDD